MTVRTRLRIGCTLQTITTISTDTECSSALYWNLWGT